MEENQIHIPEGWVSVKFKDYIYFQEGPGLTSSLFKEVGFPFLNIRCIENSRINKESCQFISPEIANGIYSHFQLEENDLVVSTSGTLGKKAFVKKNDLPLLLNTSIIRFKPIDEQKISLAFLNQLLEDYDFLYDLYSQSTGSAQVNVGPTHLKKLNIKIPTSVKEQSQIATILSKVDETIVQTEQLIAKYTRIKTGLMQDLLTKGIDENGNIRSEETHEFKDSPLGRIPKEWECEFLGKYASIMGGYAFKSNDFSEDGLQLIRMGNLYNNQLSLHRDPVYLPSNYIIKHPNYILKKGDLIMSMTGTSGKRDYGFTVEIEIDKPLLLNQRVCKFKYDENRVDKNYLINLLHSEIYLATLYENATGTKQANLNSDNILNIYVPFPSKDEQKIISKKFISIDKAIRAFNQELAKLKSLKIGLMQDLLSGIVRVNHLIKETASV